MFANRLMGGWSVSIHALTRSATRPFPGLFLLYPVSIHALTRSATYLFFQLFFCLGVSIHALTRSATPVLAIQLVG